jgi:citrate synthase
MADAVDELDGGWVSTAAACARLGIRPSTLYEYVSRGRLTRRREGRNSYFAVAELDRLEARGKRSVRAGRLDVSIDSAVTLIEPEGRLFYRGVDVSSIARAWRFERAAEWLWSGVDTGEPRPWGVADDLEVAGATLPDRLRSAIGLYAVCAPSVDLRPAAATTIGRRLLPQLVAVLPPVGRTPQQLTAPFAEQLWPRLSPLPPTRARLDALATALIVFADHELVPSTVVARIAASVGAPPLDALQAAMATHAGIARGGFRSLMEEALRSGSEPEGAFDLVVYSDRDPRADALIPLIEPASSTRGWRRVALALADARQPSADLALAALSVACEMVPSSTEAIYSLSRVAGLLAHVAEEYEHPALFRPRSGYRGPAPGPRRR